MVRDEDVPLSSLIDVINKCFGSELTEADQLFFDQLAEAAGVGREPAMSRRGQPGGQVSTVVPRNAGITVHRANGSERGVVHQLHE